MRLACMGVLHVDGPKPATCESVLLSVADEMQRRAVDLVLVPGDYWDASSTARGRLFARRLNEQVTSFAPMLIVAGNHDPEGEVLILDAFARRPGAFSFVGAHPIHVVDEPAVLSLEVAGQPLHVACLSDLRGTYLARRRAAGHGDAAAVAQAVLGELGAELDAMPAGPRLFVGHLTVGGARMDNDQPARAPELAFSLLQLARVRAHAYALGHVHLRQEWRIGLSPVFYTGSPFSTTYGELSPKSWTLLHWTGSGFDVEVVPTAAPRLVLLVGTWRREGDVAEMSLAYDAVHAADRAVAVEDLAGADVRLRYAVPTDDRVAAERAAAGHQADVLRAGAIACKVDPVPVARVRSRAPLLAQARTIADKVEAFWRATSSLPGEERRARIRSIVARLEPQVGAAAPVSLVRVESLAWERVGKLVPPGSLPLRAGVQAVVGPNEVGKSTLLSLLFAALWGEGPKGGLDGLCAGKGARVSAEVTTAQGARKVEHEVDRKAVTAWKEGEPTTGRRAFKRWAAESVPSVDVLEWTSFLPAEGKGLLGLVDTPLVRALLTLSGATVFDALGKLVSEEAGEARRRVRSLADAVARAGAPEDALARVLAEIAAAREARDTLAQEQAELERAIAQQARLAELERTRVDAEQKLAGNLAAQRDAEGLLTAALQAEGEAARHREAAGRAAAAEEEERRLRAAAEAAEQRRAAIAEEKALWDRIAAEARARESRLAARVAARAEVEAAAAALPAAAQRLADAERAVAEAGRTDAPRAALRAIRDEAAVAQFAPEVEAMGAALVAIHSTADGALRGPAALQALLAERAEAAQAHADLMVQAAPLASMDADAVERDLERASAEEAEHFSDMLGWREAMAAGEAAQAQQLHLAARREAQQRRREADAWAPLLGADEADRHRGALAVLVGQERDLRERLEVAERAESEQRAAVEQVAAAWRWGPRTAARMSEVVTALGAADRNVARGEAQRGHLEAACARLRADLEALALAERDDGDLAELQRVLSPKCIQAFEADAVGIEIADFATDLLQSHGFRWNLTYKSLRGEDAEVEQARWMLTDLDTGKVFDARPRGGGSSGGQGFVAMTAIFFGARAAVIVRGGGVADSTITIDEMTGAVRGPRVESWLALLRDGAERTGAKVVYMVPPNDERLIGACDGQVWVEPVSEGASVVR